MNCLTLHSVMRALNCAALFSLVVASLGLSACDSAQAPLPNIQFFEPSSASPADTLIIGEPFHVRALATSIGGGIEAVEVELTYSSNSGGDIMKFRLIDPARSDSFSIDTLLVVPSSTQPSELAGRAALLKGTVFGEGGTYGEEFPVILQAP